MTFLLENHTYIHEMILELTESIVMYALMQYQVLRSRVTKVNDYIISSSNSKSCRDEMRSATGHKHCPTILSIGQGKVFFIAT